MPIPQYRAPKDSQPWGLLGAIGRFLSPPGYSPSGPLAQASARATVAQTAGGFNLGRSAAAAELPSAIAGPERQGPTVPDRIRLAPTAPVLPPPGQGVTPIVRSEDDQYRQLLSQYGGLQKEKKYEEAEKLGMEIWQKKYGKTPMAQPGGAVGAFNPLMQRTFGYQTGEQPGVQEKAFGVPQGFDVSQGFSIGANAVPAPWNTQGAAVSAPYQQAMQQAAEKTTGEGMPDFSTTIGAQVAEALGRPEYARFLGKK